jgi:hypothetical protein
VATSHLVLPAGCWHLAPNLLGRTSTDQTEYFLAEVILGRKKKKNKKNKQNSETQNPQPIQSFPMPH